MKPLLLIIAGPTASGKTELSIRLARHFNTEIISADSRQCFREMSIGTAKPTPDELNQVRHHFINSHSIHDHFSAGKFADEARFLLEKLFRDHEVVIAVGGTGLYLRALTGGLDDIPVISDSTRQKVKNLYFSKGNVWLQEFVKTEDPVYFNSADIENPARLMRAAEVIMESGKPYSSFLGQAEKLLPYRVMAFVPDWPREILYKRINQRVDVMLQQGLVDEAMSLLEWKHLNALQTVGYKEIFSFLEGTISLEKATELIKQHSRNYAKRQLTWFRNQGDYLFVPAGEAYDIILSKICQ